MTSLEIVCGFPSFRMLTSQMSPKDRECKLIDRSINTIQKLVSKRANGLLDKPELHSACDNSSGVMLAKRAKACVHGKRRNSDHLACLLAWWTKQQRPPSRQTLMVQVSPKGSQSLLVSARRAANGLQAQASCQLCSTTDRTLHSCTTMVVWQTWADDQGRDLSLCADLLTSIVISWSLGARHHTLLLKHVHPGLHEGLPLIGSCPYAPHIFHHASAFQSPSAGLLCNSCGITGSMPGQAWFALLLLLLLLLVTIVLSVMLPGLSKLLR